MDEEYDDTAWQGWDIDSDKSDEDSDEDEDWINVDDEPLVISDSDDENENERAENEGANQDHESPAIPRISTLATSKVSFTSPDVFISTYSYILDFDTRRFCTPQRPSHTSCYQGCGKKHRWKSGETKASFSRGQPEIP